MADHQKRALVTGGAGLIGSHIVDLLIREGWGVRILDNLEPNTHKFGEPTWINPQAEFYREVQSAFAPQAYGSALFTDLPVQHDSRMLGDYELAW